MKISMINSMGVTETYSDPIQAINHVIFKGIPEVYFMFPSGIRHNLDFISVFVSGDWTFIKICPVIEYDNEFRLFKTSLSVLGLISSGRTFYESQIAFEDKLKEKINLIQGDVNVCLEYLNKSIYN